MHHIASWIWILIPLGWIGANVARQWMRLKERQLDTAAKVAGEQAAQYAANRIVTDRSGHLADEIDGLRNPASLN